MGEIARDHGRYTELVANLHYLEALQEEEVIYPVKPIVQNFTITQFIFTKPRYY